MRRTTPRQSSGPGWVTQLFRQETLEQACYREEIDHDPDGDCGQPNQRQLRPAGDFVWPAHQFPPILRRAPTLPQCAYRSVKQFLRLTWQPKGIKMALMKLLHARRRR